MYKRFNPLNRCLIRGAIVVLLGVEVARSQPPNTITVPVATTVALSPSVCTFGVTISSVVPFTVDQALNVLQGLGLSSANLNSISIESSAGYSFASYGFSFTTDYSSCTDTLSKAAAIQSSAQTNGVIVTIGASVSASQSAWNQAHQTAIPALLTLAAQQAAIVAAGLQVTVGSVVAISDSSGLAGVQGRIALAVSFAFQ